MNRIMKRIALGLLALAPLAALLVSAGKEPASGALDKTVADAEAKRLAAVEKVRPATVAVFAAGGRGGGSGVVIDPEGYALTNFHVVQPTGPTMQCGLADGVLYDAVLVGIDKVGDVALIKLIAKEKIKDKDGKEIDKPFPFAAMGDSDKVQAGDWSIAMGNPFLLATDFTPTVTYGLVSGVNRYQYPAGTSLEYTDCIQIDTSINPGNSGGPLFNTDGEVIGINGRGSFEKRGRVNSGVGYAISINQIKNFLGHLHAGLDCDHATLGAEVFTSKEDDKTMMIGSVLDRSDAYRRGLASEDILLSFADRPIRTVNQYKNALGIYPREWRVPATYKHWDGKAYEKPAEKLFRLMGVQKKEIKPEPKPPEPKPEPKPGDKLRTELQSELQPGPGAGGAGAKLYEAKPGFANYYYNRQHRKRVYEGFQKNKADFSKADVAWTITGSAKLDDSKPGAEPLPIDAITFTLSNDDAELRMGALASKVDILNGKKTEDYLRQPDNPTKSGGLLVAMNQWRRFLVHGEKGFILKDTGYDDKFIYGGTEPYYPKGTVESRVGGPTGLCDVLISEFAFVRTKYYFSRDKQNPVLLGMECYPVRASDDSTDPKLGDPCELIFSDYKDMDGKMLPEKIEVRYGDRRFGAFTVKSFTAK